VRVSEDDRQGSHEEGRRETSLTMRRWAKGDAVPISGMREFVMNSAASIDISEKATRRFVFPSIIQHWVRHAAQSSHSTPHKEGRQLADCCLWQYFIKALSSLRT
jgi:hypothetical protein